jgi:hypothetical protein
MGQDVSWGEQNLVYDKLVSQSADDGREILMLWIQDCIDGLGAVGNEHFNSENVRQVQNNICNDLLIPFCLLSGKSSIPFRSCSSFWSGSIVLDFRDDDLFIILSPVRSPMPPPLRFFDAQAFNSVLCCLIWSACLNRAGKVDHIFGCDVLQPPRSKTKNMAAVIKNCTQLCGSTTLATCIVLGVGFT